MNAVLRLRLLADQAGVRGLPAIARRLPDEMERCLDEVEYTFARYPLVLLQTVGRTHRPFIYDLGWEGTITPRGLRANSGAVIRLRPGAGEHLIRLAPLLRPLIELHWTRAVARFSRLELEDETLRDHLFGATRTSFPAVLRSGLADLQDGRCFCCGTRLGTQRDVDHVVPWARWPNDAIENLVLADRCSGHKNDLLPALVHIDRWARRLDVDGVALAELAGTARWESDRRRTIALACSAYAHLPAGTPLWLAPGEFSDDDPTLIAHRLGDIPDGESTQHRR